MKRHVPGAVTVICLLLLADAIAVLLVSVVHGAHERYRLYYFVGSVVTIVTCILILIDYTRAVPFAFVTTCLLTVDALYEHISMHTMAVSLQETWQVFRLLLNVVLYWGAFLWYSRSKKHLF